MIKHIITWLTGGALRELGAQINNAYQAKLSAQNDQARIEADQQINKLQALQSVLIAEQKNMITRWIRPAFAAPFVIYNFKIIVWDKVLKWGSTDPLSPYFWQFQMIVFGAYFLTRPFEKRL